MSPAANLAAGAIDEVKSSLQALTAVMANAKGEAGLLAGATTTEIWGVVPTATICSELTNTYAELMVVSP